MAALATTLSSAGTSTAIVLDPVKRTTTVQVTATSASSATLFVQYSLDDPTVTPAPTMTWANLSSAIASSAAGDVGQLYSVLSPLGALRISSSTFTSGTQTLKALQAITG